MKNFTIIVLLSFINLMVYSQCVDTSNIYTFQHNGSAYEVVRELKTWAAASACAVQRGGYLVQIGDVYEQNAVYAAIVVGANVSPTYVQIANGGGIAYVWLGATDQANEGTWIWDGNNDSQGVNFWNGEGNNGTGQGAAVNSAYVKWGSTNNVPNEPDNYLGAQDHAAMALTGWPSGSNYLGSPSEWNDIIGTSEIYYVIEYDSGTVDITPAPVNKNEVKVYPNPTNNVLNIECQNLLKIEIFDLAGKNVKEYATEKSINVGSLEKGVYFIRLTTNNESITKKIFIGL